MSLKRKTNGTFDVKNESQAKEALKTMLELKNEIKRLRDEHGIAEMEDDSAELKKAATRWAVASKTKAIDLGGGVYARLREDKYGGQWVATDDDLDDAPATAVPLLRILRKKFPNKTYRSEIWNRVTKRTVDPDRLQRVIEEGLLTTEEIAPAFHEKDKAPFLMVYGD